MDVTCAPFQGWRNWSIYPLLCVRMVARAGQVRADPRLLNGFNAIGYSQGNLIIRGYIERYNKPPVHTFVSMHGPLAGVAGFPNCRMSTFICRNIDRSLGTLAYTASIQDHLAQVCEAERCLILKAYFKTLLLMAMWLQPKKNNSHILVRFFQYSAEVCYFFEPSS